MEDDPVSLSTIVNGLAMRGFDVVGAGPCSTESLERAAEAGVEALTLPGDLQKAHCWQIIPTAQDLPVGCLVARVMDEAHFASTALKALKAGSRGVVLQPFGRLELRLVRSWLDELASSIAENLENLAPPPKATH